MSSPTVPGSHPSSSRHPDLGPTRPAAVPCGICNLVLVAEALGELEDYKVVPFIGRAGDVRNGALSEVELLRSEVFITNAVRRRPVTPAMKNRKPTMNEIDMCRGFLVEELRQVKPKVIVAMGDVAAFSVLGRAPR